jgi:hypothetical protein
VAEAVQRMVGQRALPGAAVLVAPEETGEWGAEVDAAAAYCLRSLLFRYFPAHCVRSRVAAAILQQLPVVRDMG